MTPRTSAIRTLLLQGSYSVIMLQEHLLRICNRKWSVAAIEASIKTLPVTKEDNLYTII